jgi:hypothetical protein
LQTELAKTKSENKLLERDRLDLTEKLKILQEKYTL